MGKARLGSGARFQEVERSAAASGADNPGAVAYEAGVAAHGKRKMEQLAAAGRKRHAGHKSIDLGGGYEVPVKPTVAQQMANHHRSIADAIARTKVRGDCSRDLDGTIDNGPNEAFVVRDIYGVLPAKEKK